MERRSLSAAVNAIPDATPEAVRQFITQERRPPPTDSGESSLPTEQQGRSSMANESPIRRQRRSSAGVTPVGLIPVTVRLRPEIAGALKRASLERQLAGDGLFTQQDIVELAIEPWLRQLGYLV